MSKVTIVPFQISSLIGQFSASEPVFVIIDVRPGVEGLPTTAYEAMGEVEADGKEIQRVFKHIKCSIEAEEAEEVSSTVTLTIAIIFEMHAHETSHHIHNITM